MSLFLPPINKEKLYAAFTTGNYTAAFDLLVQPLHEELYSRQDFGFMNELSAGQQLFLSYDYVRAQTAQGGFIQLLANGYIGLLPEMPAWLEKTGDKEMASLIDDVIKVYVLNVKFFSKEMSTAAFARLYEELKEFEQLDQRFNALKEETLRLMVAYAMSHLNEFTAT